MNEIKRQQFKKKLDQLSGPIDLLSDPNLGNLFEILQQVLDDRSLQPEQIVENLGTAVEAVQAALPDLASMVDTAEVAQSMLELVGELLSNLGDFSS